MGDVIEELLTNLHFRLDKSFCNDLNAGSERIIGPNAQIIAGVSSKFALNISQQRVLFPAADGPHKKV